MLAQIFRVEEERIKATVEDGQQKVETTSAKKTKAEEAVEETVTSLKEITEETADAWKNLSVDAAAVRDAESTQLQRMQEMVVKQKETTLEVKRDCFDPVKAGSWTDSSELQKTMASILPLIKQISTSSVPAGTLVDVLEKKPENRSSFDIQIVAMLEQDLDKHMSSFDEQCEKLSSDIEALQRDASKDADVITLEGAERMLSVYKLSSLAEERTRATAARRESLEALKKGADHGSKRHQTVLKRVLNKIPDCKSLFPKLMVVLQKKPTERDDSDDQIINTAQDALEARITSLQDRLKEAGYDESAGKKSTMSLSSVKQLLDVETKEKESKQKEKGKEKGVLEELRITCFNPLKSGEWVGTEPPKAMIKSLTKLFKVLSYESAIIKTLTGVLKMKPEDRAGFDQMMVQQLDDTLGKRTAEIEEKLREADTIGIYTALKDVVTAAEAAQEALEAARGKQETNLQEAISRECRRKHTEEALEKKRETVKERIEEEKRVLAAQADGETALQEFRTARGALAFLRGCEDEEQDDSMEAVAGQEEAPPQDAAQEDESMEAVAGQEEAPPQDAGQEDESIEAVAGQEGAPPQCEQDQCEQDAS